MNIYEKITTLRKRDGLSQEELAEKLGVSRQSVSKWEAGQNAPDLDRIVEISELFGVSTDFLLKDDIIDEGAPANGVETSARRVSKREAEEFILHIKKTSKLVAFGVFLCIVSPVALIILGELGEGTGRAGYYSAIGVCTIIIFAAIAVGLFILYGIKGEKYRYIYTSLKETDAQAREYAEKMKAADNGGYAASIICGVILCIVSVIPLVVCAVLEMSDLVIVVCVGVLLIMCAVGVWLFVNVGILREGYNALLGLEDYKKEYKVDDKESRSSVQGTVSAIYWLAATAAYLLFSFLSGKWHISWLIFAVGGVVFPIVVIIAKIFDEKRKSK